MSLEKLGPMPDRSPITAIEHLKQYVQNVIAQPFGELPNTVQVAIIYWMAVVGEAWGQDTREPAWRHWYYGGGEPDDTKRAVNAVKRWRSKFVARYGHELVCYTHVPAKALLLANGDIGGGDLVHRYDPDWQLGEFQERFNVPEWPVALCSNPAECKVLVENGTSRLRSYVEYEESAVPVYWFPHATQLKDEKDCDVESPNASHSADDVAIGSGLSNQSLNIAIEYVCKLAALHGYAQCGETALFWHLTGVIEGHRQANNVNRVRS